MAAAKTIVISMRADRVCIPIEMATTAAATAPANNLTLGLTGSQTVQKAINVVCPKKNPMVRPKISIPCGGLGAKQAANKSKKRHAMTNLNGKTESLGLTGQTSGWAWVLRDNYDNELFVVSASGRLG